MGSALNLSGFVRITLKVARSLSNSGYVTMYSEEEPMLVVKIDYDYEYQQMSLVTIDDSTRDTVRIDNFLFENDKVVRCKNLFKKERDEESVMTLLGQFGDIDRVFHLFATMLRSMIQDRDEAIWDVRGPIDWLIEESNFQLRMSIEDILLGLRAAEELSISANLSPSFRSGWTVLGNDFGELIEPLKLSKPCMRPVYTLQ